MLSLARKTQSIAGEAERDIAYLQHTLAPSAALSTLERNFRSVMLPEILKDPSRNLKLLSGPCSFSYYEPSAELGFRLLVLGERHFVENICSEEQNGIEVQSWLWDLARAAPSCLDLFVEDGRGKKNWSQEARAFVDSFDSLRELDSPLRAVQMQFASCLSDKALCPMALRYHLTDVRNLLGDDLELQIHEADELLQQKDPEFVKWWDENKVGLRAYVVGHQEFRDVFLDFLRLVGGNKDGVRRVENFIWPLLDRQFKKSKMPRSQVEEALEVFVYSDLPLDANESVLDPFTAAMDMFLIARLFSQFDKSKMSRGPRLCQGSMFRNVQNAIVYCGARHASFLRFFLESSFGVRPDLEVLCPPNYLQCMEFDPPFDFFQN